MVWWNNVLIVSFCVFNHAIKKLKIMAGYSKIKNKDLIKFIFNYENKNFYYKISERIVFYYKSESGGYKFTKITAKEFIENLKLRENKD